MTKTCTALLCTPAYPLMHRIFLCVLARLFTFVRHFYTFICWFIVAMLWEIRWNLRIIRFVRIF